MDLVQSLNVVFPEKNLAAIEQAAVPPPEPTQVLCRAEKTFVSTGTETRCYKGIFDSGTNWERWVHYPFYPGYCMAATVVRKGAKVSEINVGDRVACRQPHKQFFCTEAIDVIVIPHDVSFEAAAAAPISITAQQGVRRAELTLGETVVVIGLGIIGQLVIQYLSNMGLRRIIAVDTVDSRLELAGVCGATHAVNAGRVNLRDEITTITHERMADVVFDVTGNAKVLQLAVSLSRKLGRVILLGDTTVPTEQVLGPGVVSNSVRIDGIHLATFPEQYSVFAPWTYAEMVSLYFDFVSRKKMDIDRLISHRIPPAELPDLYPALVRDGTPFLGVVVDWSRSS